MIVLVLLVLLAMLTPLMAKQVTGDAPLFSASTNKHTALATAEAGIQWYRDNLDSHSAYYNYTAANNPLNDPALSGFCGAALLLRVTSPAPIPPRLSTTCRTLQTSQARPEMKSVPWFSP